MYTPCKVKEAVGFLQPSINKGSILLLQHIKGEGQSQMQRIYLFGVLRRFQHCTDHITTGSWKGRGNQYIQFVRVLYCKLPTNGKQLPAFPLEAVRGTKPRSQRCYDSATVAPKMQRSTYKQPVRFCILYNYALRK